jgi:hypothetical protein
MRGISGREFNSEVVDKLADWDHLECRMQDGYRSAPWKIPDSTKAFRLIDLKVSVISQGSRAPHWHTALQYNQSGKFRHLPIHRQTITVSLTLNATKDDILGSWFRAS